MKEISKEEEEEVEIAIVVANGEWLKYDEVPDGRGEVVAAVEAVEEDFWTPPPHFFLAGFGLKKI